MKSKLIIFFACLVLLGFFLNAQPSGELGPASGYIFTETSANITTEAALSLRRIALLSSGLGFFEHSGTISGPTEINLPFDSSSVNDVLASLVLNDPASISPSLRYA